MKTEIINTPKDGVIRVDQLADGQFAITQYSGREHIVFRVHTALVSLSQIGIVWSSVRDCTFPCTPLPEGTTLQVTT